MDKEIDAWMRRVKEIQKSEDISNDEDLSIALMNLISLEEHLYFTAMKTNNQKYLELLQSLREVRKKIMKKMLNEPKGEEWCISKHLLGASMRVYEAGCRELSSGRKKEANGYFADAFSLWSAFFAIKLKMIGMEELDRNAFEKERSGKMGKLSALMRKIIECCKDW